MVEQSRFQTVIIELSPLIAGRLDRFCAGVEAVLSVNIYGELILRSLRS